ncbi:MAG: hypothetical protein GY913_31035 [Proteobacteria bacterium]|nr:hypothetical protein [Pseudomonadota bacterium]MCP4921353.1 hypothetical protein [Pseudomonadota bacterium]
MTPEFLALEAQAALSVGDRIGDIRARLRLVAALAREGDRAGAARILDRAERESEGEPDLALDRATARAALDRSGALQELADVLTEVQDAEAWRTLAEARSVQGSWEKADEAYVRALAASEGDETARLAICRAENLVRHGRDAREALRPALDGPELIQLAAHQLLAGLELRHGEASRALKHAAAAGDIARARRNWFALSCATLDAEAAWTMQGQPEAGFAILHGTLAYVRKQGDPGVLLLARLVEIQEAERRG